MVVGDRKMAVFDDTQPWPDKLLLYPHQINWQNNQPMPVKAEAERVEVVQDEPLKRECLHFIKCMGNCQRPVTDGAEGLRVLRVLNAAQRSMDDGGCKVPLEVGGQRSEVRGQTSEVGGQAAGENPTTSQTAVPETLNAKPETFFSHATAVVDEGCEIGAGTKIWHFSHVLPGSRIGENANIGQNVVIGPDVAIGRNCKIQNNVSVFKGVTLEDNVFCGPSMVFTNVINPRAEIARKDQYRATRAKQGATLGANCTGVCGAIVSSPLRGARAGGTRDVRPRLVVGNPARITGWMCECGLKIEWEDEARGQCSCGKGYERDGENVSPRTEVVS